MVDPRYYKEALLVQNACNLSGVVFGFAEAMKAICEESDRLGKGTEWKNLHPISRLFAEQIAFLTSGKDYREAVKEAEQGARGDCG